MAVQSGYSITQIDEGIRKSILPYQFSAYLGTPETGFVLTQNVDNKISLDVTPVSSIRGFDTYDFGGGDLAVRFVGSGLGTGSTAVIKLEASISIEATSGAGHFTFKGKTRPYTETTWANAIDIPGYVVHEDIVNNLEQEITVVAPFIELSDGDTIELALQPDSGVTVNINTFSFKVVEL